MIVNYYKKDCYSVLRLEKATNLPPPYTTTTKLLLKRFRKEETHKTINHRNLKLNKIKPTVVFFFIYFLNVVSTICNTHKRKHKHKHKEKQSLC